jgi:membrane-bound ClpP family serine protease
MDFAIVAILLIFGVALMLVEIFLLPGLSIAGIGGVLFLFGGIYYAYAFISPEAGHFTLVASLVLMAVAVWIFLRSRALEKMSLKTNIEGKNDPMQGMSINEGDQGHTVSRLAPMGKVRINGQVVEAKAIDDFIDQDTMVKVIKVQSTNILVERISE